MHVPESTVCTAHLSCSRRDIQVNDLADTRSPISRAFHHIPYYNADPTWAGTPPPRLGLPRLCDNINVAFPAITLLPLVLTTQQTTMPRSQVCGVLGRHWLTNQ